MFFLDRDLNEQHDEGIRLIALVCGIGVNLPYEDTVIVHICKYPYKFISTPVPNTVCELVDYQLLPETRESFEN